MLTLSIGAEEGLVGVKPTTSQLITLGTLSLSYRPKGGRAGVEPATYGLNGRCSTLSYLPVGVADNLMKGYTATVGEGGYEPPTSKSFDPALYF